MSEPNQSINFVVAIDPGEHTGVAVVGKKTGRLIHHCTSDFVKVEELLVSLFPNRSEVKIYIELPPNFMYDRNKALEARIRDNALLKMGGNIRESELLKRRLELRGFTCEHVAPVRQKKWDQHKFQLYTRSRSLANQHERDAARLAVYYLNKR